MKKLIAGELSRIAEILDFDTEVYFSEVSKEEHVAVRYFCAEMQAEMDRIRANEGIQTVMQRQDGLDGSVSISIGVSEHEAKDAILSHLKNKAKRVCNSLGVKTAMSRSAARWSAASYPQDKEKARALVKEIRSRGLMHPFMRDTTLFGRPSEDGKVFEPEVMVELGQWQGMVHIAYVQSFEPGKGLASKAMKKITKLADEFGVTIHLTAEPTGSPVGGKPLNKSQLKSWYKRLGFKDKGGDSMIRPPS